jgi:hypothetical protein
MAYKAINNIQAVDLDSLNASSATKEYPLGTVIEVNDTSKGGVSQFMYVKAHAAFATVGTPFQIVSDDGGDAEIVTKANATLANGAKIGFNTTAITSGEYFWAQIGGVLTAAASAGIAAGDHVEVLNTGTTVVVDGTTGSTVLTTKSIGVAKTAVSGGEITLVILPGRTVEIAAA